MERIETIGARIKAALSARGMNQSELARRTGLQRSSISQYVANMYEPKQTAVYLMAKALDVSEPWLMGLDAPMDRYAVQAAPLPHPPLRPVRRQKIPLLGSVAAGVPIFAEEDHDSYVLADEDLRCDFALTVQGDSMEPRLLDGDIVFIRQQDDVDDGEIAVVLVDDDATLKHVYHIANRAGLQLIAENPKYAPMIFTRKNCDALRILGKAIAYQRGL